MLSKKLKIEQLAKSHENRFLAVSAAASLGRTCTKLCGRFLVTRCGPSPWRGPDAPAALKNLVHLPENTFSTARPVADTATTCRLHPDLTLRSPASPRAERRCRYGRNNIDGCFQHRRLPPKRHVPAHRSGLRSMAS